MRTQVEKLNVARTIVFCFAILLICILTADAVSADDSEESSEPVVAVAAEVYDGPTYIGVIEGETYVPYGLRMNITRGNSTQGYQKVMGKQVFKDGVLQEGFSYSQGEPENGRMKVTVYYTEGGRTVSDSFKVDVLDASSVPEQAADGYYQIGTADELAAFSFMVSAAGMDDINARLITDIDMTETDYQPIGQYCTDSRKSENTAENTADPIRGNYYPGYSGKFDGNGRTVKFDLTAVRCAALIGIGKDGAEVKDITITGNITAKNGGYSAVGAGVIALVSSGSATAENCVNKADITSGFVGAGIIGSGNGTQVSSKAIGCVNEGNIDASQGGNSGGIIGTGTAIDCINRGDVAGGYSHIGGVTGGGSAINCLNTGNVYHEPNQYTNVGGVIGAVTSGGTLKDCVNLGKVTGSNSSGGIAGMTFNNATDSRIENCYNYGNVTSVKVGFDDGIAGIVGIQAEDIVGLTITDCYNLGSVTHETDDTGAFIGYTPKIPTQMNPSTQEFTIEKSYYLEGSADSSSGYIAPTRILNDSSAEVSFDELYGILKAKFEKGELPYGDEQMEALKQLANDISRRTVRLEYDECIYDGTPKEPSVIIDGLEAGDFTAEYSSNVEAGTAEVTVKGTGRCSGEKTLSFEIRPCSVTECTVAGIADKTYTGEEVTQKLVLKYGSLVLEEDADYSAEYSDNIYPGTAEVTVTGMGNYTGTVTSDFKIVVPDLTAPADVSAELYGYDDIKVSWSKVKGASGYYVYCRKSTGSSWNLVGKSTTSSIKKADFADGAKYYFRVYPYQKINGTTYMDSSSRTSDGLYTLKKLSAPSIKKSSKNYVKLSWSNIPGETGYQIARSKYRTKSFAVVKTVSSKYKSAVIKTTRNKTYYYRIRAYKTVNGTKIYGPWSSVRSYKLK